jgi:hypothetical protein
MRKIVMMLGALLLTGGSAMAVETAPYDPGNAARDSGKTVKVNRYAFDYAGRTAGEVAVDRCYEGRVQRINQYRTAGDVAAAIFTAGWYTPEHVAIQCSTTASLR